ncbi:oxidoreductase [Paenibacillus sp. MER TA 81-3]|uniref:oxidoreductase n=1 Tax=Paenibacillus sp. MER TA 81-3 TaxID=2939573 RepID=UPI00203E5D14|nr:oxidoreductase [Paenibacillus sp. MER TA 81-3]MCM3340413.1 oxidoreductase [Paenibacillus sp. MER TA 81-3]
MTERFRALVVRKSDGDIMDVSVQELGLSDLPEGSVTIRVAYSSLNYKDALACAPNGGIVKSYPFIPGIDLSGIVMTSHDPRFTAGQPVLVTGYELGVTHFGGLSEIVRVPGDWVVPVPESLSLREAMVFGTAGFTAALAVERLEQHGIRPDDGPVLVTGASGGVGSISVAMLAKLGYEVTAASGKSQLSDTLRNLGAAHVVSRQGWQPERPRALDKQRWAAVIDVCGGDILAAALASTRYGGAVAAAGLTAGGQLPTSVYPFILRGIALYGIDSVYASAAHRTRLWSRMADEWKFIAQDNEWIHEISLQDVPEYTARMLEGQTWGRALVHVAAED